MSKLIIFTDLDGTLLHPKTYSFKAAIPALRLIKEKEIPLILCSSKTRAEIEVYRRRLDNKHPFISENGGGIFVPEKYFSFSLVETGNQLSPFPHPHPIPPPSRGRESKEGGEGEKYETIVLGKHYNEIRRVFIKLREEMNVPVKGFGDRSAKEIAALAGLTLTEAKLAKERGFDEPFLFEEGEGRVQEFLKAIENRGLHWTQGRFYHIIGDNDKGKAVKILKEFYKRDYGRIKAIGIGDSFNDLPLLKEVDYPVLIPKEDGSYEPRVKLRNIRKANKTGPEGWNEAVVELIGAFSG